MLLPPVQKQKILASIREIQVNKLWTKVYSQKGLTAMQYIYFHHMSYINLCTLSEAFGSEII